MNYALATKSYQYEDSTSEEYYGLFEGVEVYCVYSVTWDICEEAWDTYPDAREIDINDTLGFGVDQVDLERFKEYLLETTEYHEV